jgi:hypothetical protein
LHGSELQSLKLFKVELGNTSTLTLPPVYFSASSWNFSAPLPFGVSGATTWLNLMTIGCWALASPQKTIVTTAKADRIVLRIIGGTSGFLP